jgi:hypothetical protein
MEQHSRRASTALGGLVTLALSAWIMQPLDAGASRHPSVKGTLHATAAATGAQGSFDENVEDTSPPPGAIACCLNTADQQGCDELAPADCTAAGGVDAGTGTCDPDPCPGSQSGQDVSSDMQGSLTIKARGLAPKSTFGVLIGGAPIGTLRTSSLGSGRARFRPQPRGRDQKLTVDPRGKLVAVTNGNGEDVLEGDISDPTTPGGIACCLNTPDQQGCDELLAADCTAAGGTDAGTGTCEPDPCATSGPDTEGGN